MEFMDVKATTSTTTGTGRFSAIAAAYSVDRTNERIIPGAFSESLRRWEASGKKIPLHWDHGRRAEDIIGFITSARETDVGLLVDGQLDLKESSIAREAWRSVKAGAVSLSFGYMIVSDRKGRGGVRELHALDLYEITLTPAPANSDTKILSFKNSTTVSLDEARYRLPTGEVTDYDGVMRYQNFLHVREEMKAEIAAKAKAIEDEAAEEEARRRRCFDFPTPPTRLVADETGFIYEVDARDPDDISPGTDAFGRLLPTANEIKRAEEQERRTKREFAERRAAVEEELELRKAAAEARAEQQRSEAPPGFSGRIIQ